MAGGHKGAGLLGTVTIDSSVGMIVVDAVGDVPMPSQNVAEIEILSAKQKALAFDLNKLKVETTFEIGMYGTEEQNKTFEKVRDLARQISSAGQGGSVPTISSITFSWNDLDGQAKGARFVDCTIGLPAFDISATNTVGKQTAKITLSTASLIEYF